MRTNREPPSNHKEYYDQSFDLQKFIEKNDFSDKQDLLVQNLMSSHQQSLEKLELQLEEQRLKEEELLKRNERLETQVGEMKKQNLQIKQNFGIKVIKV